MSTIYYSARIIITKAEIIQAVSWQDFTLEIAIYYYTYILRSAVAIEKQLNGA